MISWLLCKKIFYLFLAFHSYIFSLYYFLFHPNIFLLQVHISPACFWEAVLIHKNRECHVEFWLASVEYKAAERPCAVCGFKDPKGKTYGERLIALGRIEDYDGESIKTNSPLARILLQKILGKNAVIKTSCARTRACVLDRKTWFEDLDEDETTS